MTGSARGVRGPPVGAAVKDQASDAVAVDVAAAGYADAVIAVAAADGSKAGNGRSTGPCCKLLPSLGKSVCRSPTVGSDDMWMRQGPRVSGGGPRKERQQQQQEEEKRKQRS